MGEGVQELRIPTGPGFRVYFGRPNDSIVVLLCGGVAKLAKNASLNREHLYRMLSENGNPELRSPEALLDALGFRLSITLKEAS